MRWVILSLRQVICPKLAAHYFGPFIIEKKVGKVSYELQLLAAAKIKPIFHFSQHKKMVGKHPIDSDLQLDLEVAEDLIELEEV